MAGSRPVLEVDAPRDSIKSTGGIVPVADKTSPAWRSQAGGRDSLSNYAAVMQGTQHQLGRCFRRGKQAEFVGFEDSHPIPDGV
jgi:hypothetical protein